jgi:hypothetical protein
MVGDRGGDMNRTLFHFAQTPLESTDLTARYCESLGMMAAYRNVHINTEREVEKLTS